MSVDDALPNVSASLSNLTNRLSTLLALKRCVLKHTHTHFGVRLHLKINSAHPKFLRIEQPKRQKLCLFIESLLPKHQFSRSLRSLIACICNYTQIQIVSSTFDITANT